MSLLLSRCSCKDAMYVRMERNLWMRLFNSRRLFQCDMCQAKIFVVESEIKALNWEVTSTRFLAANAKPKQP